MATTQAYPPGGTFLDTLKKSFTDVPVGADNAVATSDFLEAAESLTTLFGIFPLPIICFYFLANHHLNHCGKPERKKC